MYQVRATLRGESALLQGAPRTSTELRLSALGMRLSEVQLRDSVRLLSAVLETARTCSAQS